jgi:hypothetical protein
MHQAILVISARSSAHQRLNEWSSPPSPALDAAAEVVLVLVSFVVVRGGSVTLAADGLVEHVADADERG